MKKVLFFLAMSIYFSSLLRPPLTFAQSPSPELATDSALATVSAEVATPTAEAATPPPKKEADFTESSPQSQDTLLEFLQANSADSFQWHKPLQFGLQEAARNGVPVNILVLILLFPVITAIIAFSRHVIGLKGFGIYTPAVLSVAFLSTGIVTGILIFFITLFASTLMKNILKRLKLQYLPRTAMLLWGVSAVVFLSLILLSYLPIKDAVLSIRVFPLLIIMLLTENFLESQLNSSQSEAWQLTAETLLIATLCSILIGWQPIQRFVLLQPEFTLLSVAAFNMAVGRYTGLRLFEWLRFKNIIDS